MGCMERMNDALDYIESHLCGDIDPQELSRITACPAALFQRFFMLTANITLSEYIRRRRLTCAAYEIQSTGARIIDIATKYGYESPDAFNVAFKRLHGVSPTMARRPDTKLKSYMRLSFTLSVKGDVEMNYRIVEKEPFTVIGKIATSSLENNIIPEFWDQCKRDGTVDTLLGMGVNDRTLGLCFGYDDEGNNDYMVGIETLEDQAPGMKTIRIPPSSWLVFEAVGPLPAALGETWSRIYGEFLPQSVYKQSKLPTMEVYFGGQTHRDDYKVEIWIPILPTNQK